MNDWQETDLGKLCGFQAGDAFSKEKQGSGSGDVPFIKVSDMNNCGNEHFINRATNWLTSAEAHSFRKHSANATVFAKIGEALRANRRRILTRPTIIDNNMMSATAFDGVNERWLFYLLQTINFNEVSRGSALPYLAVTDLKRIPVLAPEEDEQKEIAAVLSALDDKIELNRRMNETLEALAQAIFKDWFVTFGPTRRKLEGATDPVTILGGLIPDPAKAAPLAALLPGSFGEDVLPRGWQSHKLKGLASLWKESTSPSETPDQLFEHHSLPAYDKGEEPVIEQGGAILSNKFVVPENAVLLSKLNPEISRVWVPNPSESHPQIASTEFLVLVPINGVGRSLLCAIFRDPSFRSGLEGMVTGTSKSHQRISPPALMDKEIVHGSLGAFKEFDALAAPLLDKRLALRAENRTLAETRDYLLPKLMSGAVRVREAEQAVP